MRKTTSAKTTTPKTAQPKKPQAKKPEAQEFDPLADSFDWDAVNWEVLANDATILCCYGLREYAAMELVFDSFRTGFLSRLRAELKKRTKAQWEEETFERLAKKHERKVLAHRGKLYDDEEAQ